MKADLSKATPRPLGAGGKLLLDAQLYKEGKLTWEELRDRFDAAVNAYDQQKKKDDAARELVEFVLKAKSEALTDGAWDASFLNAAWYKAREMRLMEAENG